MNSFPELSTYQPLSNPYQYFIDEIETSDLNLNEEKINIINEFIKCCPTEVPSLWNELANTAKENDFNSVTEYIEADKLATFDELFDMGTQVQNYLMDIFDSIQ